MPRAGRCGLDSLHRTLMRFLDGPKRRRGNGRMGTRGHRGNSWLAGPSGEATAVGFGRVFAGAKRQVEGAGRVPTPPR